MPTLVSSRDRNTPNTSHPSLSMSSTTHLRLPPIGRPSPVPSFRSYLAPFLPGPHVKTYSTGSRPVGLFEGTGSGVTRNSFTRHADRPRFPKSTVLGLHVSGLRLHSYTEKLLDSKTVLTLPSEHPKTCFAHYSRLDPNRPIELVTKTVI